MLPAEPGSTPPPTWSAMSTVLDEATCPACSWLSPLARIPMPTAAPGYVMPHAKRGACGTPTPSLIARADVAGNADGPCPHCYPPGLARKLRGSQLPRQALRERNASGGRRSRWSLLLYPLATLAPRAPLVDESRRGW